jgi:hypothetical protein
MLSDVLIEPLSGPLTAPFMLLRRLAETTLAAPGPGQSTEIARHISDRGDPADSDAFSGACCGAEKLCDELLRQPDHRSVAPCPPADFFLANDSPLKKSGLTA